MKEFLGGVVVVDWLRAYNGHEGEEAFRPRARQDQLWVVFVRFPYLLTEPI